MLPHGTIIPTEILVQQAYARLQLQLQLQRSGGVGLGVVMPGSAAHPTQPGDAKSKEGGGGSDVGKGPTRSLALAKPSVSITLDAAQRCVRRHWPLSTICRKDVQFTCRRLVAVSLIHVTHFLPSRNSVAPSSGSAGPLAPICTFTRSSRALRPSSRE